MGRTKTGAWTVYESFRIELSFLLRKRYLRKGCSVSGIVLKWEDKQTKDQTASLAMSTCWGKEEELKYIQLSYIINYPGPAPSKYDYKIHFIEVPSNIGRGSVIYLICPQTRRRCRILYRAYGSPVFKSRYAYGNYLYYDCQRSSKLERPMNAYYVLEDHIEKLKSRNTGYKRVYKGAPTKAAKRLQRLQLIAREKDLERWAVLSSYLIKTADKG